MVIILSCISILGVYLGYILNKKYLLNPLSLFCVIIGVAYLLASLQLYNLIDTPDIVYIIAIIGLIGEIIGGFLAYKFRIKIKSYNIKQLKIKQLKIKYSNLFKLIIIVILIFQLYRLYTIFPLLISGVNLDTIRGIQYGYTIEGISYSGEFFYTYFIIPLIYLLRPVCVICILKKNVLLIEKKYCLLLFVSLIIELITSGGGRMILITSLLEIVYLLYFIYKDKKMKIQISNKMKRFLYIVSIVMIIFILYATFNRGSGEITILKSLYYYYVGGIPNTGLHLEMFDGRYTYGFSFFGSLLRVFMEILERVFNYSSELYNISINIPTTLAYTITDVGNGRFNSFVVIFYYFYYDGGYLGVLLCSMFYGFFTQKVMQGYVKHKNYEYLVLLMLILSSVSYVTIRYSYIYIYNFISLIYWFVIFKVLKIKIQ